MSNAAIKQEEELFRIVTSDGELYKNKTGTAIDNGGFITEIAACSLVGSLNSKDN